MMKRNLRLALNFGEKRKGYKQLTRNIFMTKDQERKKIAEAIRSPDFEKAVEEAGFDTFNPAQESKSKRKTNI